MFDEKGNPTGFMVGLAAEFGSSKTYAETGAFGLSDIGTWLGGVFFDWFGPKQKSCY